MAWCLPKVEAPDLTSPWDDIPATSLVPFWGDQFLANFGTDSLIDHSSSYHAHPVADVAQELF
jgi:hypothetical protein